jgi:hypothetical protein
MILLAIVAVLALVWFTGGIREMFQNPMPQPTMPTCPQGYNANKDGNCYFCANGSTNLGMFCDGAGTKAATAKPFSCADGGVIQGETCMSCPSGFSLGSDKGFPICVSNSPNPSPMGAKTNPSPAGSPSTQPMTIGVPSPCRSSYKSIPGGSMEFKCFS